MENNHDLAAAYDAFFESEMRPADFGDAAGGIFGSWQPDAAGLPRYAYTLDHARDPRAARRISTGMSSDHWHAVANDRITALAHNEGYVEALDWDRCGKYLNRWDPARHQYAGGFHFIEMAGRAWNTLWSHLPEGAEQRRYFGVGYVEKETRYGGLRLLERVEAPVGDIPALLSSVCITNESNAAIDLTVVEYWGVNLHVLFPFPVMTHGLGRLAVWLRHRFNRHFHQNARFSPEEQAVWMEWTLKRPRRGLSRQQATWGDYYPPAAFLAALDSDLPQSCITDSAAFFGATLATVPGMSGAADHALISGRCARSGGGMLGWRCPLRLAPGETRTLRYLYGYAPPETVPEQVRNMRQALEKPTPRASVSFLTPEAPWLDRELVWHAYYLQANAMRQEALEGRVVDQGSAYSMLHGASGAHRDFALFALPLTYLRPDLARDQLRFSMRAQDARTGALPYAHIGFGKQSGAGVHAMSSDLDLFLLWAAAEYLGATHDFSLLEEPIPFHPREAEKTGTGLEHLRAALAHLEQRVGTGRHGLLRCGTGDWNDALVGFSRRKLATVRRGESLLNAGLAALALPALAAVVEACAPEFAADLRRVARSQSEAARALWTGHWWARGYLGVGDRVLGADRLFLDAQAFPTLAGLLNEEEQQRLLCAVQECCLASQPAGLSALHPPMRGWFLEPGADTNGGVWAAVNAWTTWMLSRIDPRIGWDCFLHCSMKQRAEAYPDIWYGIWSGPDAFNAHYHPRPGETYFHVVTPMTDFPVMNANYHAGPLLDMIKLAGIVPCGLTIHVEPQLPFDSFVLRTPLLGAAYRPDGCRGYYVPATDGLFLFSVRMPQRTGHAPLRLFLDGVEQDMRMEADRCCFSFTGKKGQRVCWEIR